MEVEVVNNDKGELEIKTDNLTVAEILRVYLNNAGVDFAAWKREHPDKPIIFKIKDKNTKKAVGDAVNAIKKDLDGIVKGLKK
jgi:DNA-directed RNA polymerase subunit L